MARVRVVYKAVGADPVERQIEDTLQAARDLVEGHIENVFVGTTRGGRRYAIVINESGIPLGLPVNFFIAPHVALHGDVFMTKYDEYGEHVGLDEGEARVAVAYLAELPGPEEDIEVIEPIRLTTVGPEGVDVEEIPVLPRRRDGDEDANPFPGTIRDIIKAAQRQGWTVTMTGGNHYRFKSPAGPVVFTASTPSDWRAIRNIVARLRRAGLDI
jgi:predicted RNA binding protein YcfA (HicA-like mRNA interferase family)